MRNKALSSLSGCALQEYLLAQGYFGKHADIRRQTERNIPDVCTTVQPFHNEKGTEVQQMSRDGYGEATLALIRIQQSEHVNRKRLIPVVEGTKYENAYHYSRDGKWIPLERPNQPDHHYVGSGRPLTQAQLEKPVLTAEELKKRADLCIHPWKTRRSRKTDQFRHANGTVF